MRLNPVAERTCFSQVLDDGTSFAGGRHGGASYGWDCDGAPFDNSVGRRSPNLRDNGLGLTHFDRHSKCSGPVDWQLAVPNGNCAPPPKKHTHTTTPTHAHHRPTAPQPIDTAPEYHPLSRSPDLYALRVHPDSCVGRGHTRALFRLWRPL